MFTVWLVADTNLEILPGWRMAGSKNYQKLYNIYHTNISRQYQLAVGSWQYQLAVGSTSRQ
jgi:hypothetical protein